MDYKQYIFNYLMSKYQNKIGVCALMGNIQAESNFRPNNLQNSYEKKLGTDAEYTAKVNNGSYTRLEFMKDCAGYGLAQWTYWSRKRDLYDYCTRKGKTDISNISYQLEFMSQELIGYGLTGLIMTSQDIYKCTKEIMIKYENPADQSEKAIEKRVGYATQIYNEMCVECVVQNRYSHSIQFGAFFNEEMARTYSDKMKLEYGYECRVEKVGSYYKVRYGLFLSYDEAYTFCLKEKLVDKHIPFYICSIFA